MLSMHCALAASITGHGHPSHYGVQIIPALYQYYSIISPHRFYYVEELPHVKPLSLSPSLS